MKIDLFDVDEFVKINKLQEITSPILFQRGEVPHPEGLVSNEIFGITTKSRKNTFAYIDLHGKFFHPHVFKAIRRMFRNIDKIVSGESYYSIDENGKLVLDNNYGYTGLKFLYDNWEKINWKKSEDTDEVSGMRKERENLLTNFKKNEIFISYQIVIPAYYRDVKTTQGATSETDDINNMYAKLIRLATLLDNQDMFDFQFESTNYNIQLVLVDIYDYFKNKLEKKRGLIRKYLMGKSVDYCTRTVITAPTFHAERPDELFTSFQYTSVPLAQACSLVYPFVVKYIKDFFEREVIDTKEAKILYDPAKDQVIDTVKIINPESYFSDKYIKKMIDGFIKDPESRFNKIEVPTNAPTKLYLAFTGKRYSEADKGDLSGTYNREMTVTDLLYLACENVTRDKHILVTRYPINNEFGVFVSRVRISSTTDTVPMIINGELYKWYPNIDLTLSPDKVPTKFIDATNFSHAYLDGIEGDYENAVMVTL